MRLLSLPSVKQLVKAITFSISRVKKQFRQSVSEFLRTALINAALLFYIEGGPAKIEQLSQVLGWDHGAILCNTFSQIVSL